MTTSSSLEDIKAELITTYHDFYVSDTNDGLFLSRGHDLTFGIRGDAGATYRLGENELRTTYRDYFVAVTVLHGTIVSKGLDLTVQTRKTAIFSTTRLNHRPSNECRARTMNFEEGTSSFQGGASSAGATISHFDYVAKAVARHKHLGFALPRPSAAFPWQIITMSDFVDSLDTLTSVKEQIEVVSAALRFLDPRTDGISQPAADEAEDGGENSD